jgi:hypothetical protein
VIVRDSLIFARGIAISPAAFAITAPRNGVSAL